MLDITATMPAHIVVEQRYGLRLYPLAEALVFCTPTYFSRNSVNARTCLSLVGGADEILKVVADEGNSSRASRLVGAFRNIGRTDVAETILQFMTKLGHELRPEDPFEDTTPSLSGTSRNTSPHAIRIRLIWQKMRKQILDLPLIAPTQSQTTEAILSNMDDNYIRDSYHSLSIEGYRVTEGLIERVRFGEWNPEDDKIDADRKNALAARGYYQAFQQVKESVKAILQGANAGNIVSRDFDNGTLKCSSLALLSALSNPQTL